MAAIALRPNWPMVRGIFTGRVRLDYARHRHPLWIAGMEPEPQDPATVEEGEQQPLPSEEAPVMEETEEEDLPPGKPQPEEDKT